MDAAAKNSIYELLTESAAKGAAVIISSSDIEELVLVCDRVLVMADGVIKSALTRGNITEAALNAAVVSASHSGAVSSTRREAEDLNHQTEDF